jgi:hypothetical protein
VSETQTVPASEPQTGPVDFRTLAAAFGIALVIGIPAAAAALLFMGLIHKVQQVSSITCRTRSASTACPPGG